MGPVFIDLDPPKLVLVVFISVAIKHVFSKVAWNYIV